jgi:probable rRNA maturation factor
VRAQKAVPLPGTVGVALISDPAIRKLNRDFRGLDHATDVLSFPAAMLPEDISQGKTHPVIRGDLAVSVDAAARQAKRFGHPLQSELKILILHGLLHLAGHDHENDRGEMGVAEERLRRRFRLPSALIARTLPSSPILPSRART